MNKELDEGLGRHDNLALNIAKRIQKQGGKALIVGGYVRDLLRKQEGQTSEKPGDIDLEVFGILLPELKKILQQYGTVSEVGEQFQVLKIGTIDVSIPRKDSKSAPGHKGFAVEGDPTLSFKEAARRRDFTINAIGLDPLTGEIQDPYGGEQDIQQKVLRAVSTKTFADDPLRPLRAMQFAGRFGYAIEKKTEKLCKAIDLGELPVERIGEEWKKLLLFSKTPSIGIQAANQLGILQKLHPELAALVGVPQNPKYHPEGDVFAHTLMAVDVAATITRRESLEKGQALVVLMGALCHDLGKATTTKQHKGRWVSHGHSAAGLEPATRTMQSMYTRKAVRQKVQTIIRHHMFHINTPEPSDENIQKHAYRLFPASIQEYLWVIEADILGRGASEFSDTTPIENLHKKAEKLGVLFEKAKPFVQGKDLIAEGYEPGEKMGSILESLYNAQLKGKFSTTQEGIDFLKKQ